MKHLAMREWTVLAALGAVAAASRLLLAAFPAFGGFLYIDSFAAVGAVSVAAGFALRSWKAPLVPLAAMAATDALLYALGVGSGFPAGFLLLVTAFVYAGFALMAGTGALVGRLSDRMQNRSAAGVMARAAPFCAFAGGSLWGTLLYDAWTNFGFWLGPFYAHDLAGLSACYAAAVPFALGHLLGMALLSPLAYAAVVASRSYVENARAAPAAA